jgi:hypothetical protein
LAAPTLDRVPPAAWEIHPRNHRRICCRQFRRYSALRFARELSCCPSGSRCPRLDRVACPSHPGAHLGLCHQPACPSPPPHLRPARHPGAISARISPPKFIPALSQVMIPVVLSRVARNFNGLKSAANSGGGSSPSGTKAARSTSVNGPVDERPDVSDKRSTPEFLLRSYAPRQARANQLFAAAFRAIASSAEEMPPCAADQATGSSRKCRTSARLPSENAGRSLHASSTSHHVHR